MNRSAIYSKTGKGVQESSGKTSHLSRADRAVLSAIDGKTVLAEVQKKFEKLAGPKFEALIQQLDKDGFIREVSAGASQPAAPVSRTTARSAPPPKAPAADSGEDEALDFTQAGKVPPKASAAAPPKAPPVDLAAASRAEADRKAKEQDAFDYKARAEAEAKAKAEAEAKARAAAIEARARVEAEVRAKAAAEAKAKAELEAKAHADADTKVKSAREAAVRMATEANAKVGAADRERQAAEERARKESEDKARLESELNAKLVEERKAREDAERRVGEATERARKELEEKARRDAEELRQRLEAEMKAKLDEERKAREAEDRKRREEEDRKRAEEDDRRRKEEEARRAKEEAERKAREEEDRKRREEEDRKRREEDDRRRKEEEARRAKEEGERRAREEQDSKRRKEEEALRAKEDADRRKREDDERRRRDEAERKAKHETEAKARAAQSASLPAIEPVSIPAPPAPAPAAPPPAAAGAGDIGDSLLADLESFSQREEEETRAKAEADRKAKEAAARRAKEEAERNAKEETEKKRREEEARRRKEEDEKRAREDAERQAREEQERLKEEEAERKRKAKETLAAKKAEEKSARAATAKSGAKSDDDIGVSDDDLDMDEVRSDHKALSKGARKTAQEHPVAAAVTARRPVKWGRYATIALFLLLVGSVGVLNVMPVSTAEYENAASEAMGVPVKIGSARLAVITRVEVRFENVSIGDSVKIRLVRGSPEIGSLFGGKKAFSRIELEGASISQAQLADAVLGKVSGENFRVGRIVIKQAKFDGPLALPPLDVEATVSGDGTLQSVTASGGDKLSVQLSPKGSDIGFEISAGSLALPIVPALTLSDFGMKGTANRGGVVSSEFDGRVYDGVISGSAKIRWGGSWNVDGEVRARAIKVAVFAPALVSEGKLEGKGSYSMSGSVPASLFESARVQVDFKIEKGVLGSFNLTRALQTGGAQSSGRTEFSELTGQAVYDKGALQVRNVSITAGAMNAGASLDIDPNGGLSGRIAADVKTPNQTLRAALTLSGKIQDPVIRK